MPGFERPARELETDDNEKHFNEKLGKIAKQSAGALLAIKKRSKKKARA